MRIFLTRHAAVDGYTGAASPGAGEPAIATKLATNRVMYIGLDGVPCDRHARWRPVRCIACTARSRSPSPKQKGHERADWCRRAGKLVDVDAMLAAAVPGPPGGGGPAIGGAGGGPQIPPPDRIATVVFDPEHGLTTHEKEFSHAQLLAAVAYALPYGIDRDTGLLDALADQVGPRGRRVCGGAA